MRGLSAQGLAASKERVESVSADHDTSVLGSELFAVATLLGHEAPLRRALTDPSAAGEAKSQLAKAVFDGKVSDETIDVLATAASSRWSAAGDFVDAVEQLGALAFIIQAEKSDQLSDLEDELFRFGRVVLANPKLRDAITNRQVPVEHRQDLVRSLLEDKASPAAVSLAVHAVASRQRSVELALEEYEKQAADRQQRLVAVVRSAVELTDDQRTRLAAALAKRYGRDVHLNIVLDPEVMGGLRVELGDDVIDGTVSTRLAEASRRIAR
jgi:F-type H+-transporting ATPase subunit delta